MERVRRKAEQMMRLLIYGIAHRAAALGNRHSQISMPGEICPQAFAAPEAPPFKFAL
jgi:hypothetical protein